MNKKIVSVAVMASALLVGAQPALAVDLSKLQVKISNNINADCMKPAGHDAVLGCYSGKFTSHAGQAALVFEPTVYLSSGLPSALVPYVLLSNVGQYVVSGYSEQELALVFNPLPNYWIRETAGNAFAVWVLGGSITPAQRDFFLSALNK